MRGYKQVKHIEHLRYFQVTCWLLNLLHSSLYTSYVFMSNGIYLVIFWCPNTKHYSLCCRNDCCKQQYLHDVSYKLKMWVNWLFLIFVLQGFILKLITRLSKCYSRNVNKFKRTDFKALWLLFWVIKKLSH